MRKKIIQILVLIFILSLLTSLTSSLGSRNPGAQERLIPSRRRPSEIRTARSASALWVRNYGRFFDTSNDDYDDLFDAQPAWDGGLVLTGTVSHTFLSGHVIQDALVMEIGPLGEVVWEVLHEAAPHMQSYNGANALTRTRDGGYLVVGRAEKFNSLNNALLVLKVVPPPGLPVGRTPYYHFAIAPEWVKSYSFIDQGDASTYADPMDLVETTDGGYVLGGLWGSSGQSSYWLMKLDPAGNVIWHEDIRLAVVTLIATPDAGFVAAGNSNNGDGVQIVKFDSDGWIQWAKTYQEMDPGWGCDDYAYYFDSISSTADGGFIMAGKTTGCACCHNDETILAWLCKLDQGGSISWSKGYNVSGIGPMLQTADGGYLMPLSSYSSKLMKVDSLGSIEWVRSYSGLYPALAFQSEDGGYMVAGEAEARLMVMRIDSAGHLDSSCSLESDSVATTREARISAVSTTLSAPSENSVQVNVLEAAPYPRTCEIRDLCPGSQGSRSRQAGKPEDKKSPSLN